MAEERVRNFQREARETLVKSSLTGVGITVLAVTALSPAGFGGLIGTSVASAIGKGHSSAASDPFARLPPFPTLLSHSEVDDIRSQIATTSAAMEITRAATEDRIEYIRELADQPGALWVAPVRHLAKGRHVTAPADHAAASAQEHVATSSPKAIASTPAPAATVLDVATVPADATVEESTIMAATPVGPISFGEDGPVTHLQLAAMLLGND